MCQCGALYILGWGRPYGLVLNPFPRNPVEDANTPATKTRVRRGDTFRLGYTLLIHESAATFDGAAAAEALR